MANLEEDNPTDGNSPTADDFSVAEAGEIASGQAADPNPEALENQAQVADSPPGVREAVAAPVPPKAKPAKASKPKPEADKGALVLAQMRDYQRKSEDLLQQKEILIITYVLDRCPRPYYQRWKEEANRVFTQAVAVKTRQKIARRRQAKAAEAAAAKEQAKKSA